MSFAFSKRYAFLALGLLAALVVALGLSAGGVAAFDQPSAQISGVVSGEQIVYSVSITNPDPQAVGPVFIAAKIPDGSTFDEATATPAGAQFVGVQDGNAVWLADAIPPAGSLGPFSYRVNIVTRPTGTAWAFIHWQAPEEGTYVTPSASFESALAAAAPRRGCQACHAGQYSLAHEAETRGGENHPPVPADATVANCLTCHAAGTGARANLGVAAPINLRDIAHPSHMFSATFTDRYAGNCFSCHNVQGDGSWVLLSERLSVNEKGIPLNPPVTGIPATGP